VSLLRLELLNMNGATMNQDLIITRLESCSRLLSECQTLDQAKSIATMAEAVRVYAQRSGASLQVINHAQTYKLLAERKLGELLEKTPKNSGGRPQGKTGSPREPVSAPTLSELGITKKVSVRAQQLARVSEEGIKAKAEEATAKGEVLSARAVVTTLKRASKPIEPLPEGKFSVIYADPPWRYEAGTIDPERTIENHYPTLSLDEIKALPVSEIAARDCVLFLWFPPPKVEEALQVARAWEFIPRTCASWDKEIIGPGHYFRQQFELLLVAIRGTPGTPVPADRVPSVYRERRGQHSKKPDYFRKVIERMYPQARRVELFARETHPGWTVWGNEVTDPSVNTVTPDSHTLAIAWRYRMADDPAAGTLISKTGPQDRASVEANLRKQHGRAVIELEPCA
jgi:N6-adenosine-specific RNA methylase IME4